MSNRWVQVMYMVMSVCMNSDWDDLARFMVHGRETSVLEIFLRIMTTLRASLGACGIVDGYVVMYMDSAYQQRL